MILTTSNLNEKSFCDDQNSVEADFGEIMSGEASTFSKNLGSQN